MGPSIHHEGAPCWWRETPDLTRAFDLATLASGKGPEGAECPSESENVFVGGIWENVEEHVLIIQNSVGRLRSWQAVASLFLLPLPVTLGKIVIQNYRNAYLQLK